eukprot:UN05536
MSCPCYLVLCFTIKMGYGHFVHQHIFLFSNNYHPFIHSLLIYSVSECNMLLQSAQNFNEGLSFAARLH